MKRLYRVVSHHLGVGLQDGFQFHQDLLGLLSGDGPVLDMLLEAALVGENLVADVATLLPDEQELEEEAIDPADKGPAEGTDPEKELQ